MNPKKVASLTAVRLCAAQRDGRQIWRRRQRRLWKICTDGLPGLPRVSSPFFARLRWLLALSCMVAAGSQANSAPPTAEIFGALPAESFAALSPDAHWIAWKDQTERKPHIVIFDLNARRIQRMAALPEQTRLRRLLWSDNETLLATVSEADEVQVATNRARTYYLTIALNPTGDGADVALISRACNRSCCGHRSTNDPSPTAKPHTVIMSSGAQLLRWTQLPGRPRRSSTGMSTPWDGLSTGTVRPWLGRIGTGGSRLIGSMPSKKSPSKRSCARMTVVHQY